MAMMRLRREDPRVVGSFRLHRRLGAGGMGVVYLGSDKRGQRVALKLIRPELAEDQEFRSRFAREVSAASRIRGGCTARLVAADIEADRPWLATQYVPGPSLYDKVGDQGPLPAAEVASIGAALAEGLVAVHEAGVVHRDLKPSNILLSPKGPRIIDFGIAWATGASTLTHVGTAVGSPGFLAPEQVRGAAVTPSTDVFALGATLAYAATADSPFGHGSSEVMLYRVVHEEPDLRAVPSSLTLLIASCLAKDPDDRPSTAQLHERLGEIHAREARGLDPVRGFPTTTQDRPKGRDAAHYAQQRTEQRRPGQASGRGTSSTGRPTASTSSSRPGGAPSRPGNSAPRPGNPSSRPGNSASRPGRPPAPTQRIPGSPRPPGRDRDRRLLRQRLVVFVTVTLLVAAGIATAQGCQGPDGNDGLGRPDDGTARPSSSAPATTGTAAEREPPARVPKGNVAPPAPGRGTAGTAAAALSLTGPPTQTPHVDWANRRYTDPAGGGALPLRNGELRSASGDQVKLTRLLPAGYDGRPAQVVVLTRVAGPVREHLVEMFAFHRQRPVLVASHVVPAAPGAAYKWRIARGRVVREERSGKASPRVGGAPATSFAPLADGTFAERGATPRS
ncbi:hypothetical protein GCM10012280_09490 [Wenjunlia tyrosinilytica]|uniref:Protein kinase domain-containing protein n=1 Tax=Wenjunlia tyrosinilytica TaxID=1544741 RepID=A0A918DSW4_9ACTN|nr:hypothetical protein GCM10012280_09490 [Wenjunlia tyrosinilytica]